LPQVQKIPIKTHLIVPGDDIVEVVEHYVRPHIRQNDIIIVTSKIVSICQHRIRHFDRIRVGLWARILWKYVTVPKFGIGAIGLPEKMQAAIDIAELPRIILSAIVAGITRPLLKRRGDFFRVAGHAVAEIDGSRILTFEQYCRVIIYGPQNGNAVAEAIKQKLGAEVAIIDAGDYGNVDVLGASSGLGFSGCQWVVENCRDNPLGQTMEMTPVGILRVT
jgi:F420-0:gamma-glutamyl ligase-like protein